MESITIERYLDELASAAPTPGGGATSALAGALGAAQAEMVANLSLPRSQGTPEGERLAAVAGLLAAERDAFVGLVDADAQGYALVAEALKLPRATDEERAARAERLACALEQATDAPFGVVAAALRCLAACEELAALSAPLAVPDITVAAALFRAAVEGAGSTVRANTSMMRDHAKAEALDARFEGRRAEACALLDAVASAVEGRCGR